MGHGGAGRELRPVAPPVGARCRAGPGGAGREAAVCVCRQVHGGLTPALAFALQCPIEWFHFACVDLTTKPKGKWSVWGVGLSRPAGVVCTGSPEDRRVDLPSCSLGPSGCGCGGLACDAAWSCFPGSDWQKDICPPVQGSRHLLFV